MRRSAGRGIRRSLRLAGSPTLRNLTVPIGWGSAGRGVAQEVAGLNVWEREPAIKLQFSLFRPDQTPPGMVRIPSSSQLLQLYMPGLDHLPAVHLPDYWMDRHEVTNREF